MARTAVNYRNVVIDGDNISGEHDEYGRWMSFSGCLPLMRIKHAINVGGRPAEGAFWEMQDGYGYAGCTPAQGWDWSGIRDSSEETIASMDALATQIVGGDGWPWEAAGAAADPIKAAQMYRDNLFDAQLALRAYIHGFGSSDSVETTALRAQQAYFAFKAVAPAAAGWLAV